MADESKEVYIKHNIPLTSPPTVKDELYYFFVESQDEYGTKLVATNDDYNIKENPLAQLVNNGQYDAEKQGEEDVETCIAMIMGLCSTVKEFDGRLGDMSRCMEELQESLGDALTYDDLAGVIQRSGSYVYIRERIPSWRFMRNLYGEDRRYLGMVNSVRDNISKEEVYILTLLVNDLTFDVAINIMDLLGEPVPGRRFKGIVWLQGSINYPDDPDAPIE